MESPERDRFIRCILVVVEEFPKMMQEMMSQSGTLPQGLYNRILKDTYFKKKLTPDDMHVIQTLLTDGYTKLDLTLIFKIITYYSNMFISPPTRGWSAGPTDQELSIGDDALRIRRERNIFSHMIKGELSETKFHDFFSKMIAVGRRVDKYLTQSESESFEERIARYQSNPLDKDKAVNAEKEIQDIESLEGYLLVKIGPTEFNVYLGNSMKNFIQKIRNAGAVGSTTITLYFPEVENREEVANFLESVKDEINEGSVKIKIKEAELGSLILKLNIQNSLLLNDQDLKSEFTTFLVKMFKSADIEGKFGSTVSLVMTVADIKVSDTVHTRQNSDYKNEHLLNDKDGPVMLKLEVQNDLLQLDDMFQHYLTEFFENMVLKANGRELFQENHQITAIVEPENIDCCKDSSSDVVLCSQCLLTNSNRIASKWCISCEEGVCLDCETFHTSAKPSRNHNIITIIDVYAAVSISQTCRTHGNRLELYCKMHNVPLCKACIPTKHNFCSEVVELEDVVKNVNPSTTLVYLEEKIGRILQNLRLYIKDRKSILKDIAKQEHLIQIKINETRTNLNEHLDKLEQNLLSEVGNKSDSCKSKTENELSNFKSARVKFNLLQKKILQMKTFASDLEVLLGRQQISKFISDQVQSVKSQLSSVKNYKMELELKSTVNKLLEMNDLGEIKVAEGNAELKFNEVMLTQAQKPLLKGYDTEAQLAHIFQIKKEGSSMFITGGIILPNGHVLIANFWGKKELMEHNDQGEHIRDIKVNDRPFDLSAIDSENIALSHGTFKYIEIINITNNNREKIGLGNFCWGISYKDGKLYTVVRDEGIVVLDINGDILKTIECDVRGVSYLTTAKDRIYIADFYNNTIHCCRITGEQIWVFKDSSLIGPRGISADKKGNLYVVGRRSRNLTLITHDGTVHKTLLTESDGLDNPGVVYFDNEKNKILICNENNGIAVLYNVL